MKNSTGNVKRVTLILVLLVASFSVGAQITAIQQEALANQEFRWGVGSLNAGQYTEAVISFTRSLGFLADNDTVRRWLGHAYYASGYNDAAVDQWKIVNENQGSALITSLIDMLEIRSQKLLPSEQQDTYIDVERITGKSGGKLHLPTAVHTNSDGSMYVVSMGSNRILHLTADGSILEEYGGALNSVQEPFDLTVYEDYLFITEFTRDTVIRIDTRTRQSLRFGSSGSGDGEFYGPQYITTDDEGNVYVSDWGNRRISKYDFDGNFLFSFGNEERGDFLGVQEPTGVLYRDDSVYVADRSSTGIYTFDTSGNYLGFMNFDISNIESIEYIDPETMLLIQNDRILWVNSETKRIQQAIGEENALGLSGAGLDVNDHIIATDVEKNELVAYAPFSRSAESMFGRIEHVRNADFPNVHVSLRIEDGSGNPVMGLSRDNIYLFEEGRQIQQFSLESASYLHDYADMAVLIQAHHYTVDEEKHLVQGIRKHLLDNTNITVQQLGWAAEAIFPLSLTSGDTFSGNEVMSQWKVDQALRIIGNTLIQSGSIRRGILLVSPGDLGSGEHFQNISLSVTLRFLRNNGIQVHILHLGEQELSKELAYIARESGGSISRGGSILDKLQKIARIQTRAPTGLYILRYVSNIIQQEPVQFVPISTEIEFFVQSARAEGGFFLVR